MKSALITGGSGFLGSFLTEELLLNGYKVAVLDHNAPARDNVTFIKGNIEDKTTVLQAVSPADIVFHLAGMLGTSYLSDKARRSVDVNIIGALNVYDAVMGTDKRVVNIGLIPDWDNAYMITKKAAMKFGRMYADIFDASITTLELSHVYGPGQRVAPYYKAVPTFITQALANQPLTVFGEGGKWMDLLHVRDAARAIRIAAEQPDLKGHVITVSSGSRIRVADLARKIIDMTGSSAMLEFAPMRPGEPAHDAAYEAPDTGAATGADAATDTAAGAGVIAMLPGWAPLIDTDAGLTETIDWYRSNS